jgi:hypothetical protein
LHFMLEPDTIDASRFLNHWSDLVGSELSK